MSEREHVSPGQSSLYRIAGVLLVAAAPVVFELASGVWPGDATGEGGTVTALSASESERVEASVQVVRNAIVAALIALGDLGAGASGIILVVSGHAHRAARISLKAALLAGILSLLLAPILNIHGGPASTVPPMTASASESASVHTGESK